MLENKPNFQQVEEKKKILYIPVEAIRPNPYQPRRQFNAKSMEELCESIKQYGVIQPISVRKINVNTYELVAGERRLRASKMAGLEEIPAIVVDMDDNHSAVVALIENLQREDLNFFEEAEGYNNLISDHGFTQEELAIKIGKSQSTIANKIRLLKLPPLVKKIILDNNLTERHSRSLLKLHEEQLQLKILKQICEKNLNVKMTEELIEKTIERMIKQEEDMKKERKLTRAIKDIRIFVNTIKEAINIMKSSGINAKAAQFDRGEYYEFVIRVPKKVQ